MSTPRPSTVTTWWPPSGSSRAISGDKCSLSSAFNRETTPGPHAPSLPRARCAPGRARSNHRSTHVRWSRIHRSSGSPTPLARLTLTLSPVRGAGPSVALEFMPQMDAAWASKTRAPGPNPVPRGFGVGVPRWRHRRRTPAGRPTSYLAAEVGVPVGLIDRPSLTGARGRAVLPSSERSARLSWAVSSPR
jgi:hypothetical protein